jgi:hypothetical protein
MLMHVITFAGGMIAGVVLLAFILVVSEPDGEPIDGAHKLHR